MPFQESRVVAPDGTTVRYRTRNYPTVIVQDGIYHGTSGEPGQPDFDNWFVCIKDNRFVALRRWDVPKSLTHGKDRVSFIEQLEQGLAEKHGIQRYPGD